MNNLFEEIETYHIRSRNSNNYKNGNKKRLDEFLIYLADETGVPVEEVHLERIYEEVSIYGKTLFFSSLDTILIEKFFELHLHKSYHWLHQTKRALQSFFVYLNKIYDFPILTEEMNFDIDAYKQRPKKKDKYVPTRYDLLKFLQSLLRTSSNLERDLLFFLLLMTTGCRSIELLSTKVNEIDFVNELIYKKKTKNKSSKYIVLREGFGELLQRYIKKFKLGNEDYLINKHGKKIEHQELQEVFEFYLRDANLPFSTLHKLRHSFATIMAESGAEILVIQQLLGHKRINSTKAYIDPNYIRNSGLEIEVNKEVYKHIRKYKPIKKGSKSNGTES